MKILFDTDTIIDYLTKDKDRMIMDKVLRDHECAVSLKTVADIHYHLKEAIDDEENIKEMIDTLRNSFVILALSSDPENIDPITSDVDYENAILISTASDNNYDCIVIRNNTVVENSPIRILTLKQLAEIL